MHHAELVIDSLNDSDGRISEYKEQYDVSTSDTRVYVREKLLIEDVREIIRTISQTPLEGEKTLTIIAAQGIDHEAQNALLKVVEEPPAFAYVILIIPREDILLPTLRSRFIGVSKHDGDDEVFASEYLGKTPAQRQKMHEKIVKDKDTVAARALIRGIEVVLGKQGMREDLDDVMAFRQYIEQRGASIKFMLEHLALSLPQIK